MNRPPSAIAIAQIISKVETTEEELWLAISRTRDRVLFDTVLFC
jgi:hypothetical protein